MVREAPDWWRAGVHVASSGGRTGVAVAWGAPAARSHEPRGPGQGRAPVATVGQRRQCRFSASPRGRVVCRPLALCWGPRGPCHTRSVFTGPEWLDLGGVVFPAPRPGGASGSLPRAAPTLACPCPQNPPPFAPFWPGSPASTSTPRSPDIPTHLRLQQRVPRASLRSPDPATWRLKPGGGGEKPEARWGPAPSPAGVPRGLKKLQLDSLGRGHHRTALIFKCMGSGLYKLAGVFTKSWGSSERRGRDRDRDRQTEGETHRDRAREGEAAGLVRHRQARGRPGPPQGSSSTKGVRSPADPQRPACGAPDSWGSSSRESPSEQTGPRVCLEAGDSWAPPHLRLGEDSGAIGTMAGAALPSLQAGPPSPTKVLGVLGAEAQQGACDKGGQLWVSALSGLGGTVALWQREGP